MRDKGFEPSVIISSPAIRAKETAKLVKETAGFLADLRFEESIYEGSTRTLLQVVSEVENSYETAMLVGHNPGIEGFIRLLTDDLEPMPTAAVAVINLNIASWNDVVDGCGKVKSIFRPKDLTSS
jgi:phosphohistidine phosphatase